MERKEIITTVSKELLDFLKELESFVSKPYLCPSKVPTIGYGTTYYFDTKKRVTMADKHINEDEALRLKLGHINEVFAPLVNKLCRDDLNQNEFDALVSFVYNAGATYITKNGTKKYYNLFRNVNTRLSEKEMFNYWSNCAVTGGGVRLNGLIRRRKREVDIYIKCKY
jgi:lysozyme